MPLGKSIKITHETYKVLVTKRRRKQTKTPESYDSVIRRLLGIPDRKGNPTRRETFYVLTKPKLQIFTTYADAKGVAIVHAVRRKIKIAEKPIAVMRVP